MDTLYKDFNLYDTRSHSLRSPSDKGHFHWNHKISPEIILILSIFTSEMQHWNNKIQIKLQNCISKLFHSFANIKKIILDKAFLILFFIGGVTTQLS